ncbi:TIGR00266 family protein [Phocoenobacter skyensis]
MQWYFMINNQQQGPFDSAAAQQMAAKYPKAICWREGLPEWVPVESVDELSNLDKMAPPPPPRGFGGGGKVADEVDYVIYGEDMQFVEVELDPQESAIAEAGAMMYKDSSITMETVFGDGSHNDNVGGFMGKLLGAGKRLVTGESLFTTVFTHQGQGKARVAFGAPFPGTIIPLSLDNYGGRIICQKDSFLAGARGVSIGIHFQKKILTGLFGGEGFIMQKLEGDGLVFIHAGGTLKELELQAGQTLHVDTGCLVALTESVHYDVEQVGGIKSMMFGGEGVFYARLQGPGKVWLQSLPFSRLAGRMLQASSSTSGKGEGSALNFLGGIGDLLDGDND